MNYGDAAAAYLAYNAQQGRDSVPLGALVEANALDAIAPGNLGVNGAGLITFKGKPLAGPAIDLPTLLDAPGFGLWTVIDDGTSPFKVSTTNPPSVFLSAFHYNDLAAYIGKGNVAYLNAIRATIVDRVIPSKLLPADEMARVVKVIDAGVVCIPTAAATLRNLFKGLNVHYQPDFPASVQARGLEAWADIVTAFEDSRRSYLSKSFDLAVGQAKAAAANADFWDTVYKITEHIRDAPAIVGAGVAGGIVDTFTGNFGVLFGSWKTWALLGGLVVIGGGALYARKRGIGAIKSAVGG